MAIIGSPTSSGVDTYETVKWTLDIMLDTLNPEKHFIWEPFKGSGSSTLYMRSRGFEVTNGDHDDFFRQTVPSPPNKKEMVLVSNPPFSTKQQILDRLKQLGIKRWALLLPLACLNTCYFPKFVDILKLSIIFHYKQPRFLDPEDGKPTKKGSPFEICWFCVGLAPPGTFTMPAINTASRTLSVHEMLIRSTTSK
jgi:hypothetical protein